MTSQNTPPTPDAEDIRALLFAYAIGATDPDETVSVEAYLREHPEARAEVAEIAAAAGLLMGDVPRREPPAGLRQKVLDAARAQRPVAKSAPTPVISFPTQKPSPSKPIRQTPMWAWVSTAAAVVLLVMNVFSMAQINELRARQVELEQTNQDQLASIRQASQAWTNDVMSLTVTGVKSELMDNSGEMRAMVMWQPEHSEAVMFTHSLPMLDHTRTYQLWLIGEDGKPISAGTFTVDSDGRATVMFDAQIALDAFSGVAISIEPMGGSDAPTTTPLAVSAL